MKVIGFGKLRHYWPVYLLILPALGATLLFSYFPAASAIFHSFYRWDSDDLSVYVGLDNFIKALGDPQLGNAFILVMILIFANLFKMVPSIVTAVLIHRLQSARARYIYRVMFVIPMIVPAMVWLLIWKYFYDSNAGVLNQLLNATGLMGALQFLDKWMPKLANGMSPVTEWGVDPLFGTVWGLLIFGALLLGALSGARRMVGLWMIWIGVVALGYFAWGGPASLTIGLTTFLGMAGIVAAVVGLGQVIHKQRYIRSGLVHIQSLHKPFTPAELKQRKSQGIWLIVGGVLVSLLAVSLLQYFRSLDLHTGGATRTLLLIALALLGGELARKFSESRRLLKWIGIVLLIVGALLVITTQVWATQTDSFQYSKPAWLGDSNLIVPALIFWGFPWVGVVSVLLYLSGLGNIDSSVYEASEIDGCNWFRKFWNIELPLIMTQVRLNLVLMVINTLKGWGLVYILLGDTGGPGGAGMLPGLYMFRKAFTDAEAGYACAIGMLLFLLILYLTLINNRYVRVEK